MLKETLKGTAPPSKTCIRAEQDPDGSRYFLIGTIDEPELLKVPFEEVQRVVFAALQVSILCDASGDIMPCPSEISDDLLDEMFADGRLSSKPVDLLVSKALQLELDQPVDDVLPRIRVFHERLQRSLAVVQESLLLMKQPSGHNQTLN